MELFDKKFVHFMWDDELRGKECFYNADIDRLRQTVNSNDADFKSCLILGTQGYPFRPLVRGLSACCSWKFAYYDPNYECKVAYNEGKQIQHREKGARAWCDGTPAWDERYEYRIKPFTYYVGIGERKTLTWSCEATSFKHVYASLDNLRDADTWILEHRKFVPVMRAFEKGLPIEAKYRGGDWTTASTPSWGLELRYRVKPMQSQKAQNLYTYFSAHEPKPSTRRMTNRELAKWLAEGNGQIREGLCKFVRSIYSYKNGDDTPCREEVRIRAWNETEWHEPEVNDEDF